MEHAYRPIAQDPPVTAPPVTTAPPSAAPDVAGTATEQARDVASTAKDQAASVASTATEQTKEVVATAVDGIGDVASTAKEQVGTVALDLVEQARTVLGQARDQASETATAQTNRLAEVIRTFGEQATALAEGRTDESGQLGDQVTQIASKVGALADRIEERGVEGALDDARTFARSKPGLFLLGAGAAGLGVGLLLRGAKAAKTADAAGTDALGATTPAHLAAPFTPPVTPIAATTPFSPPTPFTPPASEAGHTERVPVVDLTAPPPVVEQRPAYPAAQRAVPTPMAAPGATGPVPR